MLKKKLMAVGVAAVFTLSSLTTTVLAADNNKSYTNPGKGVISKWGDTEKKHKFNDFKDASWAIDAIEKLAGKGVINGIGNGLFAPNSKVTNLEAIAMVFRLTGEDTVAESMNNQVNKWYKGKKTPWGQGYINLAIDKGILLKEELDDFNPFAPAKRHEVAKYIIRALGKTDDAEDAMDEDLSFKDAKDIPDESVGYVYMVNKLNIMIGDKNNKFSPMVPVTRAEMAVLLDRAEGKLDIPDTDRRKNGTVFVSVNEDDNKITVKINGKSTTFEYLDDVNVYKDGKFVDVEDLKAGDVLQLIFNKDKKIIFIEVKKNITEEASNVSFTEVQYKNLPEVLKDEVDDLGKTNNYKYRAFEYKDYVYLVASMGEQKTGGYSVDIKKLSKSLDNEKYTVTAVVYMDEPASGSINTQLINHPFNVVKFKSFDNIENVVFVDEDNDELDKDVDIEKLDADVEEDSIEGEIYSIDSSDKEITVKKSNGVKVTYEIPSDSEIEVNGDDDAVFADLEKGMKVELDIEDGEVVAVTAEDDEEEIVDIEGTINAVNSTKDTIDVKKSNGNVVTLTIPDDADITVNDEEDADFADLKAGMSVEIEVTDDEVIAVVAEDKTIEVEGKLTQINLGSEDKIILLVGGKYKTYTVDSDVKIITDEDSTAEVEDLKIGSQLTLTFVNGELTEVTEL